MPSICCDWFEGAAKPYSSLLGAEVLGAAAVALICIHCSDGEISFAAAV